MSYYTRTKLYLSEGNAHGAQAGVTLVTQTTDSGEYNFQPFAAYAVVTQEQNVQDPARVSIGTNTPDYNNIVNDKPIGSVVGMNELPVESNLPTIGPLTDINVVVTTPCVPLPEQIPTLDFKIVLAGLEM
jgi:hypothetical protein